jgi:lipopolysaccharide/colanic/teichoic acid biosynthesis glycosyltransferase
MTDQQEWPEKKTEIKPPLVSRGSRFADQAERLADLVIAAALIVLIMPLMGFVALAIKCESSGPVFDRQKHVRLRRQPFFALRFRTTVDEGAPHIRPASAMEPDRQLTRVGRLLRDTRFDCLPQLINVVRGDMSVIRAGPERPHFLD